MRQRVGAGSCGWSWTGQPGKAAHQLGLRLRQLGRQLVGPGFAALQCGLEAHGLLLSLLKVVEGQGKLLQGRLGQQGGPGQGREMVSMCGAPLEEQSG